MAYGRTTHRTWNSIEPPFDSARQRLIQNGVQARREEVMRLQDSALAHLGMARVAQQQRNAHRMLIPLLQSEIRIHSFLTGQCERAARAREQAGLGPAHTLRWFGREHVKLLQGARKDVGMHRKLAARSAARVIWHEKCASMLMWMAQRRSWQAE